MASTKMKKTKTKTKKTSETLAHLKTLGLELLTSRAHVNNLPALLSFVSPSSPPQLVLESLLSLQSFFSTVFADLPSHSKASELTGSQDDPELIYRAWLRAKFDEFVNSLLDVSLSPDSDDALKEMVLDALMEFVKIGNDGRLNSAIYHRLLHSIIYATTSTDLLLGFLASKYFKYIDVRYFTYISVEKITRILNAKNVPGTKGNTENDTEESTEQVVRKLLSILSCIPAPDNAVDMADMWFESGKLEDRSAKEKGEQKMKTEKHNIKVLSASTISKRAKLKFTKAWISFLRLPLPLDVYKEVLVSLHQAVIPYLSSPVMLCDFLTTSYDVGGVISVMALSSLFILMTQHGLEYPNFYEKLYALLVPSVFMAKHRAKFLELLDSCLKSPLLPAYLAAAFAKKLSRLSISVPPSGSLVIVALIHNLLRRHPSVNALVHKEDATAKDESGRADMPVEKLGIDPFNIGESDPKKSSALRSSLWEIDTLRHHYCPPVSRFVLSLENDLTVRAKTTEMSVEDFSSGSYATIFGDEIRRRVKQVPLAFYRATPVSLFSESDFAGWTFKLQDDIARNETVESRESGDSPSKRQRI